MYINYDLACPSNSFRVQRYYKINTRALQNETNTLLNVTKTQNVMSKGGGVILGTTNYLTIFCNKTTFFQ